MKNNKFGWIYVWSLMLIMSLPLFLIFLSSFTTSKVLGSWTGFSLDLYKNLLTGAAPANLYSAIWITVALAVGASFLSTVIALVGLVGFWFIPSAQGKFWRSTSDKLLQVPLVTPDILLGVMLFLLFVTANIPRSFTTLMISHVLLTLPFAVLNIRPALQHFDRHIYEAALDLGATPVQAFFRVVLPDLWSGIVSGFILALTISIDDFGVAFFTRGSDGIETLSTFIYADARRGGLTPELRPLFALILVVLLIVLVVREHKLRNTNK